MKKILLSLFLLSSVVAFAQDDFGLWTSVSAEHKFSKKLSLDVEGEYRTREDVGESDRWSAGVGVDYKVMKHLKATAGYVFLYDNDAKTKYYDEGDYDPVVSSGVKWTQHYWQPRHRFYAQLTGNIDLGRFNVSLRERWQYTHRSASTRSVNRSYFTPAGEFNYDDEKEIEVTAKDKHLLRSRIQVEYDIRKCPVTPSASVEFSNAMKLVKTRYTVGVVWKLTTQHSVGVQYLYQNLSGEDDDDKVNSHILSLNYKFKF